MYTSFTKTARDKVNWFETMLYEDLIKNEHTDTETNATESSYTFLYHFSVLLFKIQNLYT